MPKINGLYTGLKYTTFNIDVGTTGLAEADAFFQDAIDRNAADSIVSIVMVPQAVADYLQHADDPYSVIQWVTRPQTFAGNYTPRNKKLLSYPYKFISVDTMIDAKEYRYEYFTAQDNSVRFKLYCALAPNPEIVVVPMNYASDNYHMIENVCESVSLTGYPQCAFTIDSYRAWLAQSSLPDISAIAAGGVTALGGGGAAIAAAAAGAGASSVALPVIAGAAGAIGLIGAVSNIINKATKGAKARGTQGSSTLTAMRQMHPHFRRMTITTYQAKILDDYFDRYGYICGKLKIPNRTSRPHWNYVKTQAVNVKGPIPTADLTKIKAIYNKGVTFWRNGWEVGLYNLDNRPV